MDKSKAIEKEELWRLAIREHLGSGLTARSFCQREGLSKIFVLCWAKKIQQRDVISEMPQRAAAVRLVPVKIVAKSSHIRQQAELLKQTHLPMDGFSMSRLEVLTPCGFTVRADYSIEPTRLGALLGAIVAIANKPPQPIENGLPAPGQCAHMVLSKFGDHQLSYDNNAAGRLVKISTLGRKNFLFVGNERAGHNAAVLYSLVSSAKANGVEPFA